MDAQTQSSLLALLGEMVTTMKAIKDEQTEHRKLLEALAAKPVAETKPRRVRKKKDEPAETPKTEANQAEQEIPLGQPGDSGPEGPAGQPSGYAALEDAVWTAMKRDYGDDVARPTISQQDAQTFIVDGVSLGPQGMQAIVAELQAHPDVATPADIAQAVSQPLAAVYLVQWMLSMQQKG